MVEYSYSLAKDAAEASILHLQTQSIAVQSICLLAVDVLGVQNLAAGVRSEQRSNVRFRVFGKVCSLVSLKWSRIWGILSKIMKSEICILD